MTPKIPQPPFMAETDSKSEVLQPPPQKRMRQEPRQESPQYNPQRRSPSAPHATMLQTSTPSRNPISNTSESSVDEDYTHRDLEYVEVPTAKVEPVEIDSDIEEVDTNFDESTDFSEFFAGQSSQQQPFQDFSGM
ncbi:hypothetical protein PR048_022855 [Dryococelus australis]|uniref:Uncharacterized protein n=1 Tax=Dryococelus australis TaxID=614101 RepID=A0ABQ9GSI4_9NEOP|nr:hypothetical protein PR048_022855 [Dryococelus australis]